MAFEQISFRRYGRFYRNARKYASRREVLISTYLILSLFTVAFFAAVFIRPTAIKIARLWREIEDKRDVYGKLESKIGDLEEAQELLVSIEDDLVYISMALPSDSELIGFLKKIDYLVYSHGLETASAQYPAFDLALEQEATSSASKLVSYPFNLELEGSFTQIQSFLEELENLDRIVGISVIDISPVEKKLAENRVQLKINIDANTYSYPEGKDI